MGKYSIKYFSPWAAWEKVAVHPKIFMIWDRDFSNVHLCVLRSEKPYCFLHCSAIATAEPFSSTSLDFVKVFLKGDARLSEIIWCLPPSSQASQAGLYSGPLQEGLLWRSYQTRNRSHSDVLTLYSYPLSLLRSTWHVLPPRTFWNCPCDWFHSLVYLFSRYLLLSTWCDPGTLLGTWVQWWVWQRSPPSLGS